MGNRLHKSSTNRMVAGVCGGLGEYFDVDPTLVRLLFALGLLAGGFTLVAYVVLWIVMPEESSVDRTPTEVVRENLDRLRGDAERLRGEVRGGTREVEASPEPATAVDEPVRFRAVHRPANRQAVGGAILILLGVIFLLDNLNLFWWMNLGRLWPLALVAVGLFLLYDRSGRR